MTRYSLRVHATPTAVIGSANADPNGPWVAWADVEAELAHLRTELAKRDAMHVVLDTPHDASDGIVDKTIGEAVKQYGEQCLGWTFPDTYSVLRADLLALRETVRVLGKHVAAWKHANDMYLDGSGQDIDLALEGVRLAEEATNANPGARAAVEKP